MTDEQYRIQYRTSYWGDYQVDTSPAIDVESRAWRAIKYLPGVSKQKEHLVLGDLLWDYSPLFWSDSK